MQGTINNPTSGETLYGVQYTTMPKGWQAGPVPSANQSGASALTASEGSSPTVLSDANIRENVIPGLNNQAQSLGVTSGQQNTQGQNTTEQGSTYNDSYLQTLKGLGLDTGGMDATQNSELSLLNNMKTSNDAITAAQIGSINSVYDARRNLLQQSQRSQTDQINNALMLGGSSRYAPISSSGVLSAKENADLAEMAQLDAQENAAKAEVLKAQRDQNFQLMSKQLDILQKTRDTKLDLAKTVIQNMKDYNSHILDVNRFNEESKTNQAQREKIDADIRRGKYEFRDLKDEFGNTVGTQIYNKDTGAPVAAISNTNSSTPAAGSPGIPHSVGFTADGKVDTEAQKAYLDNVPAGVRSMIVALTDYREDPKGSRSKGNMKLLGMAHDYDPTYDESQYAARSKFNSQWTSGGYAASNNAINTAAQHSVELYQAAQKLGNASGGTNPFTLKYNQFKNWVSKNQGNPEVSNFNLAYTFFATELAKAVKNSTGSNAAPGEKEIEDIKQQIWGESSPRQANGFIETAMSLMADRANVNEGQYQQVMGRPSKGVFLPDTINKLSALKDGGLDIKVPGVNYSDPQKYIAAKPENAATFKTWATKLQDLFPGRQITGDEIMQAINQAQ